MPTVAVIGSQWGDEGKGKVIDYLAAKADMVVRSQGGNNAGHTVTLEGKKYALRLVPSGILHSEADNILGNGVVLDPEGFLAELEALEKENIDTGRVYISDRAHIVFSYHKLLDCLYEESKGKEGIGTTKNGIGPCYSDKAARVGIRTCDMLDSTKFEKKLRHRIAEVNGIVTKIYGAAPIDADGTVRKYAEYAKALAPRIRDTGVMVSEAIQSGKKVLFEGAQGSMLDLDLGTYPYVTSSHPTSGGIAVGTGVAPTVLDEIISISKAYTTRVGAGPFVTELGCGTGDLIRERGREFGTVTGRPRRCGWFDAVVVKYAARVNGVTGIALMLLDVLDAFDEVKICYAYECEGKTITDFPADLDLLEKCKPLYRTLKGWKEDLTGYLCYSELPDAAKAYVEAVEELVGAPVKIVSVGPGREQTIVREQIL
ncbi:MAG: adenylosuccinate synthase [Clostridiales Family XIII bacterium]|jgi:adenylosuccinate synthase|nr:adenylosuccinate synthase [Clostridiales Family XIII bacterium]